MFSLKRNLATQGESNGKQITKCKDLKHVTAYIKQFLFENTVTK